VLLNKPIKKDTPNTKYGPSDYSFLDLLIANISLLQITPFGDYYNMAIDKLNGNLTRKAKNPAPVASIMNWSAAQSLELGVEAIWLLQYHRKYHNYVAKERSMITKTLDKLDINTLTPLMHCMVPTQNTLLTKSGSHTIRLWAIK